MPPHILALKTEIRSAGLLVLQTSYNGVLLALSAAFERFITNTTSRFLDSLPGQIPTYNQIPDKIRKAHLRYTSEALSKPPRYLTVVELDLIRNLYNCLNNNSPYALNTEVTTINERNFTAKELGDYYSERLAIDDFWRKLASNADLQMWAGVNLQEQISVRARAKLDDFINDRNNISHAGSSQNIGPTILEEYIQYFDALSPAITAVCQKHFTDISISLANRRPAG